MSDPENFLTRWSRRKRDIEQSDAEGAEETPPAEAEDESTASDNPGQTILPTETAVGEAEAFDPASLPPLESITAETDIRAYFVRGVPAELARAALRRVWASDPAIRDFVGLSENAWDFNAPETIPGFGPITASDDVAGMMRRLMGEGPAAEPAGVSPPQVASPQAPEIPETLPDQQVALAGRAPESESTSEQLSWRQADERNESGGPNSEMPATEAEPAAKTAVHLLPARVHGGALPK
jgi:hypothetical protein